MHLETITKRRLYMFTESATMQSKGNELMNTRRTFAWAVAGRFLDRINRIYRIMKGAGA